MGGMLYERLGGYDAITAVADDLMPRLMRDPQLGRFWAHRGDDGLAREKQLLVDFLCASAGGPLYYRGRDMKLTHIGSAGEGCVRDTQTQDPSIYQPLPEMPKSPKTTRRQPLAVSTGAAVAVSVGIDRIPGGPSP